MKTIPFFLYDNISKKFIPLESSLVCGRNDGELIFPEDDIMSRRHCRFIVFEKQVYVEDLDSRNKTKVNSNPLIPGKKRKLALNDVISFGKRRLILTNQNRFPPANVDDKTSDTNAQNVVVEREDGSLTSQISGFIKTQTRLLLSPYAYRNLQIREFSKFRGWDFSTSFLVVSIFFVWLSGLVYLNSVGAFSPGLRHEEVTLLVKYLAGTLGSTLLIGLLHYLLIRRRYRNPFLRILFIPFWWSVSLTLLLPLEWTGALPSDIAENVTEHVCLKKFDGKLCKRFASENWIGYRALPPEMKQAIVERLTFQTESKP